MNTAVSSSSIPRSLAVDPGAMPSAASREVVALDRREWLGNDELVDEEGGGFVGAFLMGEFRVLSIGVTGRWPTGILALASSLEMDSCDQRTIIQTDII